MSIGNSEAVSDRMKTRYTAPKYCLLSLAKSSNPQLQDRSVAHQFWESEKAADVYSAALVIWAIRCGGPPHPALSDAQAAAAAADPKVQLRPSRRELRWPALASVLEKAWAHDWTARPSAERLLEQLEGLRDSEFCSAGCLSGPGSAAACCIS